MKESKIVSQSKFSKKDSILSFAKVTTGKGETPARVLLDTGASASFTHIEFARRSGMKLTRLGKPVECVTIDARTVKAHRIASAQVVVGNTPKQVHLLVLDRCIADVVVGMDVLRGQADWLGAQLDKPRRVQACGLKVKEDTPEFDPSIVPEPYRQHAYLFSPECARAPPTADAIKDLAVDLEVLPGEHAPIKAYTPRLNAEQEESLLRQQLLWEQNGLIERSTAAESSAVRLVMKENGTWRICCDYRGRNATLKGFAYDTPRMEDVLRDVAGFAYYWKADVSTAFMRLPLTPRSRHLTAFRTKYGVFNFTVLPFGLKHGSTLWQSAVDKVLHGLQGRGLRCYADDICVGADSLEQLRLTVNEVLRRFAKYGLALNAAKCVWEVSEVQFLGHTVSAKGIAMARDNVEAINKWPKPTDARQVRSFLGVIGFSRAHVHDVARIAVPLTALTEKGVKFVWTNECEAAFVELKRRFASPAVLAAPDRNMQYVLHTDASDFACAGALYQMKPGGDPLDEAGLRPIGFYARKFKPAEKNYMTTHKELLAAIASIRRWPDLLTGTKCPVIMVVDHRNLLGVLDLSTDTQRLMRWMHELAQVDYRFTYRKGKHHVVPDGLSRRPDLDDGLTLPASPVIEPARGIKKEDRGILSSEGASGVASAAGLVKLTFKDEEHEKQVREDAADNPPSKADIKHLSLQLVEGVWVDPKRRIHLGGNDIRMKVIADAHESLTAGHFGTKRTWDRMRLSYIWVGARADIKTYVTECTTCQQTKVDRQAKMGKLKPLETQKKPWTEIACDLLTGLTPSRGFDGREYDAVLVFQDLHSKFVVLEPVSKQLSAEGFAQIMFQRIIGMFGLFEALVSDRDARFLAKFVQELFNTMSVKHKTSTSAHPETNGSLERQNEVIASVMRAVCNDNKDDWAKKLPGIQLAMNSATNASTDCTPFKAVFGYEPRTSYIAAVPDADIPIADMAQHMNMIHESTVAAIEAAKADYTHRVNQHRREPSAFKVGDEAYLAGDAVSQDGAAKLQETWLGPYKIIEVLSDLNYKLELPDMLNRVHPVFHISKLKEYKSGSWPQREQVPRRPLRIRDGVNYYVQGIVNSRWRKGRLEYLVAFEGYEGNPTWEPAESLAGLKDMVAAFHAENPTKAKPRKKK